MSRAPGPGGAPRHTLGGSGVGGRLYLQARPFTSFAGRFPCPGTWSMTLGVLIVHEHRAHAEALGALIDAQPDLRTTGVVTASRDIADALLGRTVDVVLIDLELAQAGRIRAENLGVRLVAMAQDVTVQAKKQAVEAGATWLVGADAPTSEVLAGLRSDLPVIAVSGTTLDQLLRDARGGRRLPPEHRPRAGPHVTLSPREDEVLGLMSEGLDARSIAVALGVSIFTVRSHIKKLMAKLGAHSQLEATAIARRMGMTWDDRPN
jgi:DNA-binding NarL/FixJ family response regulator